MVLKIHEMAHWFYNRKLTWFASFLWAVNRIVFSCDIRPSVNVGEGTAFYHNGLGVVIHPKSRIGKNCKVYQNVTLGGNGKEKALNGAPIISDNVTICAGAIILGRITIGAGSTIGANSVVIKDVEPGSTVVGVPAKMIEHDKK